MRAYVRGKPMPHATNVRGREESKSRPLSWAPNGGGILVFRWGIEAQWQRGDGKRTIMGTGLRRYVGGSRSQVAPWQRGRKCRGARHGHKHWGSLAGGSEWALMTNGRGFKCLYRERWFFLSHSVVILWTRITIESSEIQGKMLLKRNISVWIQKCISTPHRI